MNDLPNQIKKTRASIVAIGFSPGKNKVTITGSGFCVSSDGKILTAAHVYNQVPQHLQDKLMAMAMVKQEPDGLEHYKWIPLSFLEKIDANDCALFQASDYDTTLLKPLKIGDSEKVEVGDDAYFIGFPYAGQLMNDGFGITLIVNKTMISNIKRDGRDPHHPRNLFIVDAISNPGNSGCPLINTTTNEVIGLMTKSFRTKSKISQYSELDIREPMHIAGAQPINLAKELL